VSHSRSKRKPHLTAGDNDGTIRVALHNLKLGFQMESHFDQPFFKALTRSQETNADLVTFGGHCQGK
jgi:hypothetical protein